MLGDKRFTYIDKAADLTLDMIKQYRDSLILISDEKQIYNPLTNSYVGIGMTAYNNLIKKIDNNANLSTFIYLNKTTNTNKEYKFTFNESEGGEFAYAYTSSGLTFNPSTGTLTSKEFKGNLKGNAETSNYSYYSNYAYSMLVKNTESDSTYYITMSNSDKTNEYSYSYVNSDLKYNPKDQTLMTAIFDGQVDPADQWGIMGS